MPQYQILRMDKEGTPPVFSQGRPVIYNDPRHAAVDAKAYAQHMGEKLCVKPVIDEGWRKRENERMMKNDYRPLPWANSRWWADGYPIWKDHYPHASLEKPGYIAYTKNEEDGTKDKQSLLRPGAYLSRYFERHMENHGIVQRMLVENFMTMYGPIDVKFAADEGDIIKVYEHGPRTCMNDREWPKGIHPVTTYAAGDLAIAYIGNLDGKVSGRALCWPEKKIHSRVYGDVARLTQGLARLGYQWGPPIGAKLKRIQLAPAEYKNGRIPVGCFLAPYIDKKNQQGGGHLAVIDQGEHLLICAEETPGSHHASLADGRSGLYVPRNDEQPRFICDHCVSEVLEVLTVCTEVNEDGEAENEESWCRNCYRTTWQCRYSGKRFTGDIKYVLVDGCYWLPLYADMYATECEGNHKLYSEDNIREVYLPDGAVKNYSNEYINGYFGSVFRSELTNRLYQPSEKTYVWSRIGSRHICAKQELRHHAFQCDGCDSYWLISHRSQPKNTDILICPLCANRFDETKQLKLSPRAENERAQINLRLVAAE